MLVVLVACFGTVIGQGAKGSAADCRGLVNEFERWVALESPSAYEYKFQAKRVNMKLLHKRCSPLGGKT
eukprot:4390163-Pyramimonas_sp.AAC.3